MKKRFQGGALCQFVKQKQYGKEISKKEKEA
jgi:hypothetical protein